MSDSHEAVSNRLPGLVTGLTLLLIATLAAWAAFGFDTDSRPFPFGLAVLLALTGAGILLQALTGLSRSAVSRVGQGHVAIAATLLALWALAFNAGLGFMLPVFALQAGLLWLFGLRRMRVLLSVAAAITFVAWLLFVVLLDIPLPLSLLPDSLQRF